MWQCAGKLANIDEIRTDEEVAALEKYILDINAEGELLREIDDVKDELRMMIYFKERQQHVLSEFKVHVEQILDQSLERLKRHKPPEKITSRASVDGFLAYPSSKLNQEINNWTITPEKAKWTKSRIADRQDSLKGQHAELSTLYTSAELAEAAVRSLLVIFQSKEIIS